MVLIKIIILCSLHIKITSVFVTIIDDLSRQLAAYLMVGAVVMLCSTGWWKSWFYVVIFRRAVILRVNLALPLLRLFRRPRPVAFRPLLSETSKLRKKDSER